jgi:hypothetical protein
MRLSGREADERRTARGLTRDAARALEERFASKEDRRLRRAHTAALAAGEDHHANA